MVNRLPFKAVFVQTDNGLEFQSRFTAHAQALHLAHHHIHKSTPNENAVIERSFRTDEEEFIYFKAPFTDYDDLRQKYAAWLQWYNTERPHLGINLQTPLEVLTLVANVVRD
jgi:transposase InsO family protein